MSSPIADFNLAVTPYPPLTLSRGWDDEKEEEMERLSAIGKNVIEIYGEIMLGHLSIHFSTHSKSHALRAVTSLRVTHALAALYNFAPPATSSSFAARFHGSRTLFLAKLGWVIDSANNPEMSGRVPVDVNSFMLAIFSLNFMPGVATEISAMFHTPAKNLTQSSRRKMPTVKWIVRDGKYTFFVSNPFQYRVADEAVDPDFGDPLTILRALPRYLRFDYRDNSSSYELQKIEAARQKVFMQEYNAVQIILGHILPHTSDSNGMVRRWVRGMRDLQLEWLDEREAYYDSGKTYASYAPDLTLVDVAERFKELWDEVEEAEDVEEVDSYLAA